ncbi:MAG: hypothetical protein K9K76_12115 [Halanaerobiales bacterium]|nr:hypothetical protein [Halanaerobiales bacterium]
MSKKGTLKYSREYKFWYILSEDGSAHKLSESDLLDVDLKLSDYYIPCAINFQDETIAFSNTDLGLNRFFNYDIIFYLPWRNSEDDLQNLDDVDVPF